MAFQVPQSIVPVPSMMGLQNIAHTQAVADAFRSLADLIAPRPSAAPQIHILMPQAAANLSLNEAWRPQDR